MLSTIRRKCAPGKLQPAPALLPLCSARLKSGDRRLLLPGATSSRSPAPSERPPACAKAPAASRSTIFCSVSQTSRSVASRVSHTSVRYYRSRFTASRPKVILWSTSEASYPGRLRVPGIWNVRGHRLWSLRPPPPGNARTSLPPWPERGSLPPSGRLAIAGVEIVELLLEGLVNRFLFREPVVAGPRVVSRQNTRTEHVASSVRWKTLICGRTVRSVVNRERASSRTQPASPPL